MTEGICLPKKATLAAFIKGTVGKPSGRGFMPFTTLTLFPVTPAFVHMSSI